MERGSWTDERLDDLAHNTNVRFDQVDVRFDQVDARFDRVDARFNRVDARFDRVEGDIRDLRSEMRQGFGELRAEVHDLQLLGMRLGGGMLIAILGVIAAILTRA